MLIRPLVPADIPAVAALLRELAREYIVHESPPEGASTFLAENDEMGVRGFLARGHVYHVAVIDGAVAGFVAVRDRSHLFHLFVGKRWHRRGVARALWLAARDATLAAGGDGAFTVNSSNFAVPVYEAFGFVRVGPTQFAKGLYFNPMRLAGPDDASESASEDA
ncbi:GNAT family N-acetyltransferase [Massilia sp. X63]|uniref:GNAT family N-acetyltransferase n=1 Tax=Massilia sp. X63 TaxID=3237285 RepID=UPI0034DD6477